MELDIFQDSAVKTEHNKVLVIAGPGSGKALKNGTGVLTPTGFVNIETLKIGDKVIGQDGNSCSVLGVYPQGEKKICEVEFSDGAIIECCEDHLWNIQSPKQRLISKNWETVSTKELLNKPLFNSCTNGSKRHLVYIPMVKPINFQTQELPLSPYLMGALLGDGYLSKRGSTPTFSNADKDVLDRVEKELNIIGYTLNFVQNYDYSIIAKIRHNPSRLISIFEELGLSNKKSDTKFIPDIYKFNSKEDRLELLKGLIDTDGFCAGSSYEYVSVSEQLCDDVKFLCESLGMTANKTSKKTTYTYKEEKKEGKLAYRLRIKPSESIAKIHFSQKRERQWKQGQSSARRTIVRVEETTKKAEMTCIQVSNKDELFVIDNCIITHNTRVITERIKHLLETGCPSEKIAAITFTNLAAQEMRSRLPSSFNGYIGTIHSLASKFIEDAGLGSETWYYKKDKFNELVKVGAKYSKNTYDHVLVDELQDISSVEFNFIRSIEAKNYFLVGDDWQSIYKFKGADPKIFMDLIENEEWHKIYLLYNYRSNSKICNFGFNIISNTKKKVYKYMTVSNENEGFVYTGNFQKTINIIKQDKNHGDWMIVTRLNDEVDYIKRVLEKERIPCVSFKKSDLDNGKIKKIMSENVVKVLTIHSAKGLESKNVVVFNSNMNGSEEEIRVAYVAATRAKENLYWCGRLIRSKEDLSGIYLNTRGFK